MKVVGKTHIWASLLLWFLLLCGGKELNSMPLVEFSSKFKKTEARADRNVFYHDYKKALKLYTHLLNSNIEKEDELRIKLKIAQMYVSIRNGDLALPYYEDIIREKISIITVDDACNLVEILRREDNSRKAEQLVRLFAKNPSFSENTRFRNLFVATTELDRYKGDSSGYLVKNMPFNTKSSDFWIGFYGDTMLYITNDRYSDTLRNFFKGALFYTFDGFKSEVYDKIRPKYQAGPAAFSNDGLYMIFTDNRYGQYSVPRKLKPGEVILNSLQLTQATYNEKKRKWENLEVVFKDNEAVSFCHPCLLPDGKTLIFCSNMKGGYGGMDLYKASWNESRKSWENIVNLGAYVNTENDELYPFYEQGQLYFASNGHVGLGGFDIYEARFFEGGIVEGTLSHFPYPINSTFNDFAVSLEKGRGKGYFTSDRRGGKGLDDIYSFTRMRTNLEGLGDLELANKGALDLGNGKILSMQDIKAIGLSRESIPDTVLYKAILDTSLLATIYFDFDSYRLNEESEQLLEEFVSSEVVAKDFSIMLIGYADEIGSEKYNDILSRERSSEVKKWLINKGFSEQLLISIGRGQIKLSDNEMSDFLNKSGVIPQEIPQSGLKVPLKSKLKIARRVEVKLFKWSE